MGISYSTHAVWGFKLDIKFVSKKKTKYHEDTGAPYQVDVPSHLEAMVEGIPVAVGEESSGPYFYSGDKICGLTIFESGDGEGDKFLGIVAGKVNEDGNVDTISVDIPSKVQSFAQKYQLTPKLFLIQSCG
jgi:hypothetical protein